jgi:hypothetical protein
MGKVVVKGAKNITKKGAELLGKIAKKPLYWKQNSETTTTLKKK